jgi:hypothetical protein
MIVVIVPHQKSGSLDYRFYIVACCYTKSLLYAKSKYDISTLFHVDTNLWTNTKKSINLFVDTIQ